MKVKITQNRVQIEIGISTNLMSPVQVRTALQMLVQDMSDRDESRTLIVSSANGSRLHYTMHWIDDQPCACYTVHHTNADANRLMGAETFREVEQDAQAFLWNRLQQVADFMVLRDIAAKISTL